MVKSDWFAPNGFGAKILTNNVERLMTSIVVTILMMFGAIGVSLLMPFNVFFAVGMFGPGLLIYFFGGKLPRSHYMHGLSTNQRLAIERYESADEETKKLFAEDFVNTVRNARGLGPGEDGIGSERYELAVVALKILEAAKAHKKSLGQQQSDKVITSLQFMRENLDMLEREVEENRKILS